MYFLNINKPLNMSSFDVIRELRKKLKIRQIGHSGTLDPLAEGVLQVAVGSATKLLDYLPSDKTYVAEFRLGYVTETFDSEFEPKFVKKADVSLDELTEVINSFVGISMQIPPKYSAIKQNGTKLCDLARKNVEIALEPREIEIYGIRLLEYDNFEYAKIEVDCKKGTYIRSLVNDIGLKLGCGAYLTALTRTRAGKFNLSDSNNLTDSKFIEINPLDALDMPVLEINEAEYNLISNGNFINNRTDLNGCKILLSFNKILVSVAEISDNLIKPKKNFKGV